MENRINNRRRIIIGLLVILFLYDAFQYNHIRGSNFEITNYLFNMILFIAIIIFLIHKKDFEKRTQWFQKKIDDYFY